MEKIKAFIVNRNLLTTLVNTVEFLQKEPRVEVVVFDQQSTYPPLLDYYKNSGITVVYSDRNGGPNSVWGDQLKPYFNNEHFIVADSDCLYEGVPSDWLDRMLEVLEKTPTFKVGFSLEINNLPNTDIANEARNWESKYWTNRNDYGWNAYVDTTFALYRPNSRFAYDAVRLDRPYCIKHAPWYLTKDNLSEEWSHYINTVTGVSTWGSRLKTELNKESP